MIKKIMMKAKAAKMRIYKTDNYIPTGHGTFIVLNKVIEFLKKYYSVAFLIMIIVYLVRFGW